MKDEGMAESMGRSKQRKKKEIRRKQVNLDSIQKFGFINGVDNVNWPPYRDSKS